MIVDAVVASPTAAKEAALLIRKFLGKNNFNRAYVQYNAIMLIRILADSGASFTKNVDNKFVATVKELLRDGRDPSVQTLIRESLDTFELQRADDETLQPLIGMWKNEKAKWSKRTGNDISSAVVWFPCLDQIYDRLTPGRCKTIAQQLVVRCSHLASNLPPVLLTTYKAPSKCTTIVPSLTGYHRHMN